MIVALVVLFAIQALSWVWIAIGLGRVREVADAVGSVGDAELSATTSNSFSPGGGLVVEGTNSKRDQPLSGGELQSEQKTDAVADPSPTGDPVSVVVAARDEAERLPTLLDALAAQTHRPFEVVVVDDRSADGTAEIVRARSETFPVPLRVVCVADGEPEAAGLPPKKHAIERGVASATHERIAFTDADGQPGPEWLATLARWDALDAVEPEGADSVLVGYGPYQEAPGALNRFVRYETAQTAVLAAAAIGWGRPWHAVGRNLSYSRGVLDRLGGFAHSANSLSGDDDLLVQEVARRDAAPVRYVWDKAAAVPSPAPPDWSAFWRQKRRHASAGTHYPATVLIGLGVFHTSNLALWIGGPLAAAVTGHPIGLGLLAAKLLIQRTVLLGALDDLGDQPDLRLWQPVLDAASAVYHAVLAVLGALPTPTRW